MRLIDADKIVYSWQIDADGQEHDGVTLKSIIDKIPTIDTEIIHCRECKHYYYADNRVPQEQMYVCDLDGDRWRPDSFCSFGERREE